MIELRWMIRQSDEVNLDGPGPILNRVLQYRRKMGENSWGNPIWGEWTDVPTVREDV